MQKESYKCRGKNHLECERHHAHKLGPETESTGESWLNASIHLSLSSYLTFLLSIFSAELSLPYLSLFRVFSKAKRQNKRVLSQVASSRCLLTAKRKGPNTPSHGFCPPNHICENLKANVAGCVHSDPRRQQGRAQECRLQSLRTPAAFHSSLLKQP